MSFLANDFYALMYVLACEPWDISWVTRQSGDNDKGTLQEMYGAKV